MGTEQRPHILAYDISDPIRLRSIAKCAQRYGVRVQYSFFLLWINSQQRDALLQELADRIDEKQDDIRLYPLLHDPQIRHAGKRSLPAGVQLYGDKAAKTLHSHP